MPECSGVTDKSLSGNLYEADVDQTQQQVFYCNKPELKKTYFVEAPCFGYLPWTEVKDGKTVTTYMHCDNYFIQYALISEQQTLDNFEFGMIVFFALIILIVICLGMNKIGFSKVFGFFFYYLSFHFVLKFIIRSRLGFTLKKKIDL